MTDDEAKEVWAWAREGLTGTEEQVAVGAARAMGLTVPDAAILRRARRETKARRAVRMRAEKVRLTNRIAKIDTDLGGQSL